MLPSNKGLLDWWGATRISYKGIEVLKPPGDLWSVQEIIHDTQPDVIVETGTWKGGSAHFYADLGPHVVTIDKAPKGLTPLHPRVTYLRGYSTNPRNVYLANQACLGKRAMVILDSDHSKQNVLDELNTYAHLVAEGCYLIVEDTALGRILQSDNHDNGDGPADALDEWLPDHPEFTVDEYRERIRPTMHPGGYLLRQ